jgi:hypothetical protein
MINQTESDAWFGFTSHKARISPPDGSIKFEQLQLPDIRTAPDRPIAPFGARERTVGAPQALFAANTVRKKIRRGRTAPIGDWRDIIRTDDDFKDMDPFFSLNGACFYIHWNPNSSDSAATALCCIERRFRKNQMLRH